MSQKVQPNPQEIADALADFKSLTLKVKSAWIKDRVDTYKIVKKKSGWEYTHMDNHQKFAPVMCMHAGAAKALIKQVLELGLGRLGVAVHEIVAENFLAVAQE